MVSSASLLLLLLSVAAILLVDARPPENKIVGGSKIDIKDVPWQVALGIRKGNDTYICGGSIINEQWIMTAAHCTEDVPASNVTVRAGSSNRYKGGSMYRVVDIKNHPRYVYCLLRNDIALVKTDRPIVFGEKMAKATLPAAGAPPPQVGTPLLVSGWGFTSNGKNANTSEILMAVEIKMDNFGPCEDKFPDLQPDPSTQICAGHPGRDACGGDSGGPLMEGKVVIGVVSYGNTTVCGASSGGYTKVSAYIDWINGQTQI